MARNDEAPIASLSFIWTIASAIQPSLEYKQCAVVNRIRADTRNPVPGVCFAGVEYANTEVHGGSSGASTVVIGAAKRPSAHPTVSAPKSENDERVTTPSLRRRIHVADNGRHLGAVISALEPR